MASHLQRAVVDLLGSDKLPSWFPLHHFNEPTQYNYTTPGSIRLLDVTKPSLWVALGCVVFNPVFWNIVARNEYRNKTMTKMFGSPYLGCYVLAVMIFSLGIFRDLMYERALRDQPHLAIFAKPLWQAAAWTLIALGQLFVVTSIYALGITGTYLGDYFGILMSHRVTGFPFNVLNDPMYVGSTLAFVGSAILYRSPAGLMISSLVWVVYSIALKYEGPFTDKIYSAAHKKSEDSKSAASPKAGTTTASSSSAAPTTPTRKSGRIAHKASNEQLHTTAESSAHSYAEAAAHEPDTNGLPSVTPRKIPKPDATGAKTAPTPRTTRKSLAGRVNDSVPASPARMTRSRSKARTGSDSD